MYFISITKTKLDAGLDSWGWLSLPRYIEYKVTAFGDVFFTDAEGRVHFLDTLDGVCNCEFQSIAEFDKVMKTEDGQNKYLLAPFVDSAIRKGMYLKAGECYDWILNPMIGGRIANDNIQIMDFVVSLNIAGQIRFQIKDLAPGTVISSIQVDGAVKSPSVNKSWWKLW